MHDHRPTSFRKLEEKESIQDQELLETFADYADGGWAIFGEVVINLADRAKLSTPNYFRLAGLALHGAANQQAGGRFGGGDSEGFQRDTAEYLLVLEYARFSLAKIASTN